jgi:peroxiredoxin Q/BCP
LTFALLSDTGGKVRKMFGVPTNLLGMIPGRVTYVVNKQGVVVLMFSSQTKAELHISEALDALKKI